MKFNCITGICSRTLRNRPAITLTGSRMDQLDGVERSRFAGGIGHVSVDEENVETVGLVEISPERDNLSYV